MKKLLYLAIGVVIGASIGFSPNAYAAVKQFVLTEFNRPVVVNGVVYKDAQNPILNYNGKTYIPLAKIGDLTGVSYKWNAEKKQVEIGSGVSQTGDSLTYTINDGKLTTVERELAEEQAIRDFTENIKIESEKKAGVVIENGEHVLYLKNKYGSQVRLTNSDDIKYVMAKIKKQELPPSISEGWISEELLSSNIQGFDYISDVPENKLRDIATKNFNGTVYYNIDDLIVSGLLKIE
ncbi:stalk domain-containing protein [Paenibacillus phocaensis]|uniref:stalk domain-containing protein n=1 Tax=Paenibacillus phocaensis TaxID=1776378 RepID=UPI000839B793|nr:hypothetical protein [Paenibacillus phocaensis]